jgi:hypothetical protein
MPIVTISIALRACSPEKQGSRQKTLTYAPVLRAAQNWWEPVLLDLSFVRPSHYRSNLLLLSRRTAPIWMAADTTLCGVPCAAEESHTSTS